MAEETGQERSEQPTTRRLTKAREEGQVPRSQELMAATILLAGAGTLAAFGGSSLGAQAGNTLREAASWLSRGEMTAGDATVIIRQVMQTTLTALLPVLLVVVAPVILIGGLQARGVLSLKPLVPDFSRVSPMAGFKRIFGVQAIFTLGKAALKLTALSIITWIAVAAVWPRFADLAGAGAPDVLAAARESTMRLVLFTGLAFLAASLADYGFEAWRHLKKLRMTRHEIIQEHRETEGDPHVKSRIRSLQQQMTRRRMLHRVKEADVVVVNPTNIAVALRYDGAEAAAPVVLAMGRRKLAERIRELAKEAGIPIVRNVPVARALIASSKIGMPIPPALYAAVAEVLAYVYRLRGRMPRGMTARSNA